MKRLRDAGLTRRTVTLTIRYADLKTITRAHTLREPTHLDPIVLSIIQWQFTHAWDTRQKSRLLGVALSFTSATAARQLDLLDAAAAKNSNASRAPPTNCATASDSRKFNWAAPSP